MAELGGGSDDGHGRVPRERAPQNPNVANLLQKLNLMADEGDVADFSDDEGGGAEWAVLGKVISPSSLHANTIRSAMTPAWGNPFGLKIRSIGERGENLFVAEFGCKMDMERVLAGSPWIAGKHAVILKEYVVKLKPSEICFDRMDIWVRLLNLPLGWMNQHRGIRAMRLLGEVKQVDVDADGKAGGAFLRARVAIDINKPIKRGVLLRMTKDGEPEWFHAQYEKLPFFCFSCGMLGHGGLECGNPAPRNAHGKLPYEREIPLRAPEDKRKKVQSFVDAAAESFGSGTSSGGRPTRAMPGGLDERREDSREEAQSRPRKHAATQGTEDSAEITSPLKRRAPEEPKGKETMTNTGRQLFQEGTDAGRKVIKKRKSKRSGPTSSLTPDLNLPLEDTSALVPAGLVSSRVNQLVGSRETGASTPSELSKKQKTSVSQPIARSAVAADGSPCRAQ
ncbi:unnamed protein product [Urochloa humidicola]